MKDLKIKKLRNKPDFISMVNLKNESFYVKFLSLGIFSQYNFKIDPQVTYFWSKNRSKILFNSCFFLAKIL